jgi:5'-3' exonuclease
MDELLQEISLSFNEATDKRELVSAGYAILSLPYCPTVIKKAWPVFLTNMRRLDAADHLRNVVVVDFSALFHAYFYLYEDRAAQETFNKISNISLQAFGALQAKDCEFIVALDSQDGYWRSTRYPDYKSSRKAKPDGFEEIQAKAISLLREADFRIEQHSMQESDDIMSSIAFMAKARKQIAVLITDDRDLLQCLGKGVCVYSPRAKELRDEDWLMESMGITPKQMVDWLCLVGKDDIPSPKDIGEVTASKWLKKYSSVMDIYDARSEFTEHKRNMLEEYFRKDYWLARDLHTTRKNLNIFW